MSFDEELRIEQIVENNLSTIKQIFEKIPEDILRRTVKRIVEKNKLELLSGIDGAGINTQAEIISALTGKSVNEVSMVMAHAMNRVANEEDAQHIVKNCPKCKDLFHKKTGDGFLFHCANEHPRQYESLLKLFTSAFPSNQEKKITFSKAGLMISKKGDYKKPFILEEDLKKADLLGIELRKQVDDPSYYVDYEVRAINLDKIAAIELNLKFKDFSAEYILPIDLKMLELLRTQAINILDKNHQICLVVGIMNSVQQLDEAEKFIMTHKIQQFEHYNTLEIAPENTKLKPKIEKKIKPVRSRWREFERAREYLRARGDIFSRTDYINATKQSDFPDDIPVYPHIIYKGKFTDYADFCGYERKVRRPPVTKEVINTVIQALKINWDYYRKFTDGMMTDWFTTMGLFSIKDPIMKTFFTELISWRHRPEGREAIKYWLKTGDYLKQFGPYSLTKTKEEKITDYLDRTSIHPEYYQATGLVEEDEAMGIEKIMLEAKEIIPITKDTRWFEIQVRYTAKLLWQRLFDHPEEWKYIRDLKKNGNSFHDTVLSRITEEHRLVMSMNYDKQFYTFPFKPTFFQLYSAWIMRNVNGFLNMGSTGSGKTGAAIIATKATKAKHVLVICPNNIKEQWTRVIEQFYKGSFISSGKKFHDKFFVDSGIHTTKYHIVNYDKFGKEKIAKQLIDQIKEGEIDFVILDEAQFVKKRELETHFESTRRKNISLVLEHLRSENRKLKVMMLSATPVINNIREGVSLLNMLTGTQYNIPTHNTIRNATRLYTEFQPFSIVYQQRSGIKIIGMNDPIRVDVPMPQISDDELDSMDLIDIEYLCTNYRIPKILEILRQIKGKAVIYTDFVGKKGKENIIVNLLKSSLERFGYHVGLFIGDDKSGLILDTGQVDTYGNKIVVNPFLQGSYDVIIASPSFAVGIDEVQYVCNNIIFNGLVWTWAQYEQIIGRLARTGQTQNVNVFLVMAKLIRVIDGKITEADYDYKMKYDRILHKKEIGDCVRYGTLPEKIRFGDRPSERLSYIIRQLKGRESNIPIKEIKQLDYIDELEAKIANAMTSLNEGGVTQK